MRTNLQFGAKSGSGLALRIRGMFNLNDPRWGRGGDQPEEGGKSETPKPGGEPP